MKTPYYTSGVLIESSEIYTKIYAKLGMVLMWNQQDALMVCVFKVFFNWYFLGFLGQFSISVGKRKRRGKKEEKNNSFVLFLFIFII